jgi:hypothetical protein
MGRNLCARRRIGLRQEPHGGEPHAPLAGKRARHRGRNPSRRPGASLAHGTRNARSPRREDRDGLSGILHGARPRHDGGRPARRNDPRAPCGIRGRSEKGSVGMARARGRLARGRRTLSLSARTLGRTKAARHNRHGALGPPRRRDRRRTHDGARRDAAGTDSEASQGPAEGNGAHAPSHHARPRGREADGRPARPHVRGRDRRNRDGRGLFLVAPPPLCGSAFERAPRHGPKEDPAPH